ncbi:MAG: DUF5719 family protein [Actinomycetota bacterium]
MKHSELVFAGVLLAVAVVAAAVTDLLLPTRRADSAPPVTGSFLSSGWYCPSPSTAEDLQAHMVTGNLSPRTLGLRSAAFGGQQQSGLIQSELEAGRSNATSLAEFALPDAAGVVDAFGGASTTDLVVLARDKGAALSRCSDQPSDRWLFATGNTARGESHILIVANPFREEAVVQVRFLAPDRDFVPARLKDLVIPPRSEVAASLVEFVVETPSFGMEVSATRGRVVASRYSVISRAGAQGISLDTGQAQPSGEWTFPEGRIPQTGEELLVVINPGEREALVGVVFMTEGERTAPPALAEVPVPAGRQVSINLAEHLPAGTSHGILLTSGNAEPVVAERITAGVEGNRGYESAFGVAATGLRWAVTVGSPGGGTSRLALVNPGDVATSVSVRLLRPEGDLKPPELQSVQLAAGRKRTLDLTRYLGEGAATAVVESSLRPIALESTTEFGPPYSDTAHSTGHRLP